MFASVSRTGQRGKHNPTIFCWHLVHGNVFFRVASSPHSLHVASPFQPGHRYYRPLVSFFFLSTSLRFMQPALRGGKKHCSFVGQRVNRNCPQSYFHQGKLRVIRAIIYIRILLPHLSTSVFTRSRIRFFFLFRISALRYWMQVLSFNKLRNRCFLQSLRFVIKY